jgi:hypothetical protein
MTSTLRPDRGYLKTPVRPRSFSILPLEMEVLKVLEEDMGGSEKYEASIVLGQSGTKSNNSRASFVFTNQDVNLAAQLVSSEDGAEGATPILSYHCI